MKRYRVVAKLVLVVGLTLLSGVLHGRVLNRWGVPEAMRTAGQRLKEIPAEFPCQAGSWRLEAEGEPGDSAIAQLKCIAWLSRTYRHQRTGEVVTVALILGPAGPMSVHTPDICVSSRDYQEGDARHRVTLPGAATDAAERFWAIDFRPRSAWGEPMRVYYAWSAGGSWLALDHPRFATAGWPYLYKIQVAGSLPRGSAAERHDACRSFLNDYLPAVRNYLVSPPSGGR